MATITSSSLPSPRRLQELQSQAASSWDGQPDNLGCFKTLGGAGGESSPAVDTQETLMVSFLLPFFPFLAIIGG